MTTVEIKYVEKLKELIDTLYKQVELVAGDAFLDHEGYGYKALAISQKITHIESEIEQLGKQCQFEMLCDPDIFEASANEHFEEEGNSHKCRFCGSDKVVEHREDPSFKLCLKCGANYKG